MIIIGKISWGNSDLPFFLQIPFHLNRWSLSKRVDVSKLPEPWKASVRHTHTRTYAHQTYTCTNPNPTGTTQFRTKIFGTGKFPDQFEY